MRSFLFAFLVAASTWSTHTQVARAATRPNILFVFIDDMGYGDLACFGNTQAKTPAIDSLAREGIRFRQFYVNAPICSPSRVAVTTGQYPSRWRITSYLDEREMDHDRGVADWLDPAAPSLARILAHHGYYTAHVGKWHMGGQRDVGDAPPITDYGFATSLTNFEGLGERVLPRFAPGKNGKPLHHKPTQMSAELGGGPIHSIDRDKVTAFYVDRALAEIQRAQIRHQPFYINLWPDDVHSPVQAAPERRGDGSPRAQYLGVLAELDRQLGRVFDAIRADPALRNNTIIVIASDNGPEEGLGSTGGLRGSKGNLYEGGIREPLIVWSSRIEKSAVGSTDDVSVIAGMDLPPTLLRLADIEIPRGVKFDGIDVSGAWLGHPLRDRTSPIFWIRPPDRPGPRHRPWPDLAVRDGRWKLLCWRETRKCELFDIPADPSESSDVAAQRPDLVARLQQKLLEWDRSVQGAVKGP